MQFIIAMFTMDYYYWQPIPVPDYYGCAIVILMCLMGAHMLLQKQVNDALRLMRFVVEHPYNFRSQWIPLLICLVKFKVELLIEVVTLWMCIVQTESVNVVVTFVAFVILSDLSSLYTEMVGVDEVKQVIPTGEIVMSASRNMRNLSEQQVRQDKNFERIQEVNKSMFMLDFFWHLTKGLQLAFDLVFFYFVPYMFFISQYLYLMVTRAQESWNPPDNITK